MGLFRRRKRNQGNPSITFGDHDATPLEPAGRSFGFKSAWLAARAGDAADVAEALVLRDVTTSPWADGVAAVYAADARERPAPVFVGESGEVRFNEGEPTEHDEDLLPDDDADWNDWETAEEERVMEIAAAWSVDPSVLDERDDVPDTGLLGRR